MTGRIGGQELAGIRDAEGSADVRDPASPSPASEGKAPRTARGQRTLRKILDAALGEFARHGLSGARVERIAARANANKRMIYYYFGSKEDLFLAVLEASYATIRNAEQIIVLDEGQVAGKGTHEELMENCEVYQGIALSQLTREELA